MGHRVSTSPVVSKISTFPLLSEIIVEILLLLPLESIHACRLVSKEWKNLIDDSNFIKLYKGESTIPFLDKDVLKLVRKHMDSYKLRPILNQIDMYPYGEFDRRELLVDSFNKIACVKTTDDRFLLYNLLTGGLRVVADAPFRRHSYPLWCYYGFGYDPYEDDYKIVLICGSKLRYLISYIEGTRFDLSKTVNEEDDQSRSLIFVCSYKTLCWKSVEGFRDDEYGHTLSRARGFSFNGVLHWIVTKAGSTTETIVGLHLNSYEKAEFELPPAYYNDDYLPAYYNDNYLQQYTNLTTFDGRLCCFLERVVLDVWVMEDYGVANSWTKLFRIDRSRINTSFRWFESKDTRVYRDRESGKLVVFLHNQFKYELFHYDINKDQVQVFSKSPTWERNYRITGLLTGLQRLMEACCLWIEE